MQHRPDGLPCTSSTHRQCPWLQSENHQKSPGGSFFVSALWGLDSGMYACHPRFNQRGCMRWCRAGNSCITCNLCVQLEAWWWCPNLRRNNLAHWTCSCCKCRHFKGSRLKSLTSNSVWYVLLLIKLRVWCPTLQRKTWSAAKQPPSLNSCCQECTKCRHFKRAERLKSSDLKA